ncbi:hypothetical protein A9G41_08925 [Gilliamella sp. Nev5-1]|uniref:hypothetical protein n=1 Tax=unclassified Gilliamella TaxID=2685620 RepID=UPI00080E4682|nr:hypothetical protein [Gilliamella apicola]OCG59654.1 hypothetical protein A9G40_00265 [Gilliamella apicola]OCG68114.1 hypothetical protein A9G41_08925 [Gilliamella apicola]
MSINIEKPMKISFDEVEFDEHVPSIKFIFIANIEQFSNSLNYSGEIWISCLIWDNFVNDLVTLKKTATLYDMNEMFSIKIEKDEKNIKYSWSVTRQGIFKDIVQSSYQTIISEDTLNYVKSQFTNYPKWW